MSEEETTPEGTNALLGLLNMNSTDRVRKVLYSYTVATMAIGIGMKWYRAGKKRITYRVSVKGSDPCYADTLAWASSQMSPKQRKAITLHTDRRWNENTQEYESRKFLLHDSNRVQWMKFGSHRIQVYVETETSIGKGSSEADTTLQNLMKRMESVVFTCYGEKARDDLVAKLGEIADAHWGDDDNKPEFLMMRWNEWVKRSDVPERSMDSVFLCEGQREDVVSDLQQFLDDEVTYVRLGIPWRRGYLFYGPPGSGKTSLAKAIANHFQMDMYYMPLADIDGDNKLLQLVSQCRPRSMLLLEDVDVFHAATERNDDAKGATLSGLLNAIDGMATPHGIVFVLTTNDKDVLDAALLRDGRVDRSFELGYVDNEQLRRITSTLVGDVDLPNVKLKDKLTAAEVMGLVKLSSDDPERLSRNLHGYMKKKRAARG